MADDTQFFDVFAWFGRKKSKIGYAYYQTKEDSLRIKADQHIDASKLGRALLKGDILIKHRAGKPAALGARPKDDDIEANYESAADVRDAEQAAAEWAEEQKKYE